MTICERVKHWQCCFVKNPKLFRTARQASPNVNALGKSVEGKMLGTAGTVQGPQTQLMVKVVTSWFHEGARCYLPLFQKNKKTRNQKCSTKPKGGKAANAQRRCRKPNADASLGRLPVRHCLQHMLLTAVVSVASVSPRTPNQNGLCKNRPTD